MNAAGSVLLDTSIVVEYLRGDQALPPRFARFSTICIPWVVLGELYFGAKRAPHREQALTQVRNFLQNVALLLADEDTAERYGQIKAELAHVGKPIPDNDLWIAASARQHNLPLATRDEHFKRISELSVLAW